MGRQAAEAGRDMADRQRLREGGAHDNKAAAVISISQLFPYSLSYVLSS